MKVPFVDLKTQCPSAIDSIDRAIKEVIESYSFIGGRHLESFERNFARYVGVKHCIGVGNGTDALFIALKSLGVKKGDEVITVANTFIATSESITSAGAKVVFVDCNKDTYGIDTDKMQNAITKKTKAIIPVHLYGQPVDMDEVLEVAKKYNLFVVEDAAQAHGARYKNRNIGTLGDCGCFSFFPGKNLGAYGDAGAIVTNNDELAKKARMYANHGRMEKYNHEFEGVNSRLDSMQAAILDAKLKYLEKWNRRRREIARVYDKELGDIVIVPQVLPDVTHVYHLYVIRLEKREKIRGLLTEKGIATGIHYPVPLPLLMAYRYLGHKPEDFPVAYSLKDKILSLPIYGEMPDEQVSYVIDTIRQIMK